ncbi:MAG: DUF3098 domain-containing protein [Lewinellaceae bacterium]|jgi:hypothetical protein|nr:DUF3098 domain-containing protein [Lewinellaceae bacterium]
MAKQPSRHHQAAQPIKKTAPVQRTVKKESNWNADKSGLLYGRRNFIYMGIGLASILAGLALMNGGAMPDPNKWEPERIYSFTRITLAPILMVTGFVVVAIGIFKRSPDVVTAVKTTEDNPAA